MSECKYLEVIFFVRGVSTNLIRGDFEMPDDDRKIWERYSCQVLFAPIGRAGQEKYAAMNCRS